MDIESREAKAARFAGSRLCQTRALLRKRADRDKASTPAPAPPAARKRQPALDSYTLPHPKRARRTVPAPMHYVDLNAFGADREEGARSAPKGLVQQAVSAATALVNTRGTHPFERRERREPLIRRWQRQAARQAAAGAARLLSTPRPQMRALAVDAHQLTTCVGALSLRDVQQLKRDQWSPR